MSKQLRLRRGSTVQHSAFTGAEAEVTYDTGKKCMVVHDGTTVGGHPVAGFLVLAPGSAGSLQTVVGCLALAGVSDDVPVLGIDEGTRYVEIKCRTRIEPLTVKTLETDVQAASVVGGAVSLDLTTRDVVLHQLTANSSFSATLPRGFKGARVILLGDSVSRTLTWPSGWKWVGGAAPSALAASKTGLLELFIYDEYEATVLARWSVQA